MLTSRAARELLATAAVLLLLAAMPWIATAQGDPYLLKLATRIVIYGLAASALDLALGVAGLIGFGHAAFLGLGAYMVGIAFQHGFEGSTLLGLTPPGSASDPAATGDARGRHSTASSPGSWHCAPAASPSS